MNTTLFIVKSKVTDFIFSWRSSREDAIEDLKIRPQFQIIETPEILDHGKWPDFLKSVGIAAAAK